MQVSPISGSEDTVKQLAVSQQPYGCQPSTGMQRLPSVLYAAERVAEITTTLELATHQHPYQTSRDSPFPYRSFPACETCSEFDLIRSLHLDWTTTTFKLPLLC